MSQEKYSTYYVELLTSTFNDQILQNLSLKANAKVNAEIFEEVSKGYQTLIDENNSLKSEKEKTLSEKEVVKNTEIENLKKQLVDLQFAKNAELENLRKQNVDNQSSKNAEIERLKQQITQIQATKSNDVNELVRKNTEQLQQIQSVKNSEVEQLNKTIVGLRDEIAKASLIRNEYDKLKHQLSHMDTFRNQLVELQKVVEDKSKTIDELNIQIEDLKTIPATPVKRKKSNIEKMITVEPEATLFADETRDGGSF
jgi:chromosome segregation ATPase